MSGNEREWNMIVSFTMICSACGNEYLSGDSIGPGECPVYRPKQIDWNQTQELATLRAELVEAKAEVERLKGDLVYLAGNKPSYTVVMRHRLKELEEKEQQLAAQAAELERLKRELDGAVNHHSHNMNRIDRALGEPRYKDCYLVQAFERRIAAANAAREDLRRQVATGTNYTCDDDTFPRSVKFSNGRAVKIKTLHDVAYLDIGWIEQPKGVDHETDAPG